jgi:hypothetical protein
VSSFENPHIPEEEILSYDPEEVLDFDDADKAKEMMSVK